MAKILFPQSKWTQEETSILQNKAGRIIDCYPQPMTEQEQINERFSREIQSGDRVIVGLKED